MRWFVAGSVASLAVVLLGAVAQAVQAPEVAPPSPKPAANKTPAGDAVRADLELPPVGPTKAAPADRVAQEYKAARVAYHTAVNLARFQIIAEFKARRAELEKSDPKAVRSLDEQSLAFQYSPDFRVQWKGPLPTHPAMQTAVAEYFEALETAARKFGDVAAKGLAAYAKAGVTDPAKLRPLQAAKLAGENANLLGIWATGRGGRGPALNDVWIIDVEAATGGWRLDGAFRTGRGSTGYLRYAEDIEFNASEQQFTFIASFYDSNEKKLLSPGPKGSLKLQGGKLRYDGPDEDGKRVTRILQRTGEEVHRRSIEVWGVPKRQPPDASPQDEKQDYADANFVWRRLAALVSFPALRGKSGPAGGESLYIPTRSGQPTLTPGAYGGLTDMLLGRSPGAAQNRQLGEALFQEFDRLGDTPHPYLRRAASEFLALSRARLQLAEADELFGNTPNSSIREFQQKVVVPAGRYVMQREADRAELENELQRANPDKRIIVVDAPLSRQSQQHLDELTNNLADMTRDVKQRAVISGLLAYADMAQVDRHARLWETWLLPLAKRCGGPPAKGPLVTVEGDWKVFSARPQFTALEAFRLKNVSGQDLTHVAVQVLAENEWGDKAAQYYYFDRLDVEEAARLVPHPRWEKRRLPFTNAIKLQWSVWCDQGSEVDRQAALKNPGPNPDPAGWRKDYLKFDEKYQAEGEALGAMVRTFRFLPINPERQRRRLLEISAPQNAFVARLKDPGRTLLVRFLRLAADKSTVEAEALDLATRKPFRPDTPVWKGRLSPDDDEGYVIRFDSGWTLLLAQDDQPMMATAGDGRDRLVALVGVKLPGRENGKPAAADDPAPAPAPAPPANPAPAGAAPAAPADAFIAKSVWVNEATRMTFTVLERDGERFRARFQIADVIDREVSGEVKEGKVSWLARDVRGARGGPGGDNTGTFGKDRDGPKIDFTYRSGKGGGTFTLHLRAAK